MNGAEEREADWVAQTKDLQAEIERLRELVGIRYRATQAARREVIAAQATIAEALSITVDGRGIVSALGRIRDVLTRDGDNA